MYQMPQGVVYATPTVSLQDSQSSGLMFGLTPAPGAAAAAGAPDESACAAQNAQLAQQFITIPVPLSLRQVPSTAQPPNTKRQYNPSKA